MSAEGVPVLLDRADVLKALRDALNVTDNRVTQAFGKPWLDDAASRIMAIQPTHPAAASAEREALPTRGDVGRPESTRDPVFLLRWRPKKCDPGRDRWHVEGVWFTREEAEQFAKAHAYRWGSDQFGPCWHVYCVPAEGEMARLLKTVTKRDDAIAAARAKGV